MKAFSFYIYSREVVLLRDSQLMYTESDGGKGGELDWVMHQIFL